MGLDDLVHIVDFNRRVLFFIDSDIPWAKVVCFRFISRCFCFFKQLLGFEGFNPTGAFGRFRTGDKIFLVF